MEGLLHISELADHKVENAEDVVSVGDEIEVKILRVDTDERKIGLSRKRVEWAEEDGGASPKETPEREKPAAGPARWTWRVGAADQNRGHDRRDAQG